MRHAVSLLRTASDRHARDRNAEGPFSADDPGRDGGGGEAHASS